MGASRCDRCGATVTDLDAGFSYRATLKVLTR